ncbi:MAG: acetyl-CoA carboxylase biotin carboxyl carrier protein [Capsulimonas sp.]|uniref:acetyl-CoA carboxylase biotin carboxyl carrier protein n=1 Tax=Capsulimonas sp. TaxID=2494211 RepID=UPI0032658ADD
MTEIDNSTETIRRLLALVVEHGLSDLEVEQEGIAIRIKGVSAEAPLVYAAPPVWHAPAPAAAAPAAPATPAAPAKSSTRVALESPMVGVFYRSPTPDDPAFINVGDYVAIDQTIGLIEAMKTYSEVPAEKSGRVVEIVAENGKLVQLGQPLFYVEPS